MSVAQKSTEKFGISPATFKRNSGNGQYFCPLMDNHALKEEESGKCSSPHFTEHNPDMESQSSTGVQHPQSLHDICTLNLVLVDLTRCPLEK